MAWTAFLGLFLKDHRSILGNPPMITNYTTLFMKSKAFILILVLLLGHDFSLQAVKTDIITSKTQEEPKIIINNRILVQINGTAITTYDVMKKMDILFYRQFPEYISSVPARYQFYQINWRSVLDDLINKELVLADAKDHKIEVSAGDIRQEMENAFGPHMIVNLDKVGMSFDEAAKIVEGDLLIRRVIGFRVHAKALKAATPAKVQQAYQAFISDPNNARLTQWNYQVITINDTPKEKALETANLAYRLLIEEGIPLDQLLDELKDRKAIGRKTKVTISDEISNHEQELSESYKKVLASMNTGMISQPSAQKSRTTKATVYRIFYVKDKKPGGIPTFQEMENKLRDHILNILVDQETDKYLNKLKSHYRVRESDINAGIPANYQPFVL